jgi:hypothetical protein
VSAAGLRRGADGIDAELIRFVFEQRNGSSGKGGHEYNPEARETGAYIVVQQRALQFPLGRDFSPSRSFLFPAATARAYHVFISANAGRPGSPARGFQRRKRGARCDSARALRLRLFMYLQL